MGEDGFDQFFAEVGPRPTDQHSLGRIDNNKGYEPKNLAWQTKQEQAKATRQPRRRRLDFGHGYKLNSPLIPYNDEVKSMAEWARELGIKPATIYDRLIAGMSIADSLNPIPMKLR